MKEGRLGGVMMLMSNVTRDTLISDDPFLFDIELMSCVSMFWIAQGRKTCSAFSGSGYSKWEPSLSQIGSMSVGWNDMAG